MCIRKMPGGCGARGKIKEESKKGPASSLPQGSSIIYYLKASSFLKNWRLNGGMHYPEFDYYSLQ